MPCQGWRQELIGYVDGRPIVGSRCPWCHEWLVPCNFYGGKWHTDALCVQFHAISCPSRPQRERKRPWRPGKRKGPDPTHVLWLTYSQVSPNTPRQELPDELPVNLAAGLAKCDPSRIRQLCRSGELDARKGDVYGSKGWLVDCDSLLRWMVATGRRDDDA